MRKNILYFLSLSLTVIEYKKANRARNDGGTNEKQKEKI